MEMRMIQQRCDIALQHRSTGVKKRKHRDRKSFTSLTTAESAIHILFPA